MSYNEKYPYTRDELAYRQVRTTKRMLSAAKAVAASVIMLRIMQLDSQWNNHGKLYGLIVPATVPAAEVPAIGSAIAIRNRETGLDLGIWRVVPATEGDDFYGHPLSAWELCATSDHRATKSQQPAQSPMASVPPTASIPATAALTTALANRVSTRERVSHFSPTPTPAPTPTPPAPKPTVKAGRR